METKYLNTAKNLRTLRTANIIGIIAVIVGIIGGIALVMGAGIGAGIASDSGTGIIPSAAVGAVGIGGLVALVGLILSFVAGIMKIVALAKNSKENAGYKNAMILVLVNIALSFVTMFLTNAGNVVLEITGALVMIVDLFVVYFIITATDEFLREKGNTVVADEGIAVRKLYIICTAIMVVGSLAGLVPFLSGVVSIVTLVVSIVQLVALFKFIGFLGHSANALADK